VRIERILAGGRLRDHVSSSRGGATQERSAGLLGISILKSAIPDLRSGAALLATARSFAPA